MFCFVSIQWLCLRNEISSILAVVICPTVYFRYLTRPVTVTRTNWCGPLQRSRTPGVKASQFSTLENRVKEVEHKHQLGGKYHNRYYGDHLVQVVELVERSPQAKVKVAA